MSKAESYNSSILDEILNSITPEEEEKIRKRMLLAARINNGIKAKGWKKKDLALALNKQRSEITKWLSGTHNFNSDTLFDIERVLNIGLVTVDDATKLQVVRFHVVVSEKVESVNPSFYVGLLNDKSLVSIYYGKTNCLLQ
jgi:transcriptional regulator with XRE-family HTH domain